MIDNRLLYQIPACRSQKSRPQRVNGPPPRRVGLTVCPVVIARRPRRKGPLTRWGLALPGGNFYRAGCNIFSKGYDDGQD